MMFPEKWGTVHGFLEALVLPNVFPRYFEFLGACLTVTGLFVVGYTRNDSISLDEIVIVVVIYLFIMHYKAKQTYCVMCIK